MKKEQVIYKSRFFNNYLFIFFLFFFGECVMPTGNKPLYWDGLTGKEIFLHVDYFAFRTIKHTLIRGVRPKKKPECQKKKKKHIKTKKIQPVQLEIQEK